MSSNETERFVFGRRCDYERALFHCARDGQWNDFVVILDWNNDHQNDVASEFVRGMVRDFQMQQQQAYHYGDLPTVQEPLPQAAIDAFVDSCIMPYEERSRIELLCIACKVGASDRIVAPLMNFINPNISTAILDHDGMSPLAYAVSCCQPNVTTVRKLVTAFPDMAKQPSGENYLPINILVQSIRPCVDTMNCLLRAYPDAAAGEYCPLKTLCEQSDHSLELRFFDHESNQSVEMDEDTRRFLSCVHMILLAATTNSLVVPLPQGPNDKKWRPVDAAASIGNKCPLDLFEFLLAIHFGHPRKRDEEGMLPLHVIAASSCGPRRYLCRDFAHRSVLQHVLKSFPDASKVADNHGRLPLHILAGVSGSEVEATRSLLRAEPFPTWYDVKRLLKAFPEGAKKRDQDGRLPLHHAVVGGRKWKDGTELLFKAHPEALGARDPKTGLCAFLLAAKGEKCDLNTSYELLRADPTMLGGLDRWAQKDRKRKISVLEDRVLKLQQEISKLQRK